MKQSTVVVLLRTSAVSALCTRALKHQGRRVFWVEGCESLKQMLMHSPHLVIVDATKPLGRLLVSTAMIAIEQSHQRMPIIFLNENPQQLQHALGEWDGRVYQVVQPKEDQLLAAICQILGNC